MSSRSTEAVERDYPTLSVADAAERLGVTERMVRRLLDEKRIEYVKVGKHVRFRPSVIDEFIEANTIAPVED